MQGVGVEARRRTCRYDDESPGPHNEADEVDMRVLANDEREESEEARALHRIRDIPLVA